MEIHARIAALQTSLGQASEARDSITRGLKLGERLLESPNGLDKTEIVRQLVSLKNSCGQLEIFCDDHDSALVAFESAIELVDNHGLSTKLSSELIQTMFMAGRTLAETSDYESAKSYLASVLKLSNLEQSNSQFDVAKALNEIALIHKRNLEFENGESALRLAIEIHEEMTPIIARKPDVLMNHAAALNNLGNTLAAQRRWQEAESQHRKAVSIVELLVANSPATVLYSANLLSMKNALGLDLKNLGQLEPSIQIYEEAISFAKNLDEKQYNPLTVLNLVKCHNNLANLLIGKTNDLASAELHLDRSIFLTDDVNEISGPQTGELLFSRSYAFDRLAKIAELRLDSDSAVANSDRAIAEAQRLIEAFPDNRRYVGNLISVLCQSDRVGKQFGHLHRSFKASQNLFQLDESARGTRYQMKLTIELHKLCVASNSSDLAEQVFLLLQQLFRRLENFQDFDIKKLPQEVTTELEQLGIVRQPYQLGGD